MRRSCQNLEIAYGHLWLDYKEVQMKKYFYLLAVPVVLFAAEGEHNYDIVAITINFLLFAGILYYFIANPIKNAYKGRINAIEGRLTAVRNKVLEAEKRVEKAKNGVEEARERAKVLVEIGKKEANQAVARIQADAQNELISMKNTFDEQKEFAERSAMRETVSKVLSDVFNDESIQVDQKELVNLVLKKVS